MTVSSSIFAASSSLGSPFAANTSASHTSAAITIASTSTTSGTQKSNQTAEPSTPTSTAGAISDHGQKLSAGAIAGTAVGALAGIAILGAAVFLYARKRAKKRPHQLFNSSMPKELSTGSPIYHLPEADSGYKHHLESVEADSRPKLEADSGMPRAELA